MFLLTDHHCRFKITTSHLVVRFMVDQVMVLVQLLEEQKIDLQLRDFIWLAVPRTQVVDCH
jgi:hypothetical protein